MLIEEENEPIRPIYRCPKITVLINQVLATALIDSGSSVNAISLMWFNENEEKIKPYEVISMTNTLIVSAVGSKLKLIRKQIFVNIQINKETYECVFLIVPNLIHDCIIGVNFLRENACIIDFSCGELKINPRQSNPVIVEIGALQIEDREIICQIEKKIESIKGIENRHLMTLQEILINNKEVFRM